MNIKRVNLLLAQEKLEFTKYLNLIKDASNFHKHYLAFCRDHEIYFKCHGNLGSSF